MPHTFDRILVAVDESSASHAAVSTAIDLAGAEGASLVFAHVVFALDEQLVPSLTRQEFVATPQMSEALREAVAQARRADVVSSSELLVGSPAVQISLLADDLDVDLIVVGSRHLHGLKRAVLGSTSRKLIRETTRPVLVVAAETNPRVADDRAKAQSATQGTASGPASAVGRNPQLGSGQEPMAPTPPRATIHGMSKIVVGVDGSVASQEALDWAVREAKLRGARLQAVHSWTYPLAPGAFGAPPLDAETLAAIRADAQTVVDNAVAAATDGANIETESTTVEGPAAQALLDAAADADLLVVGSRGHGGFGGVLLGSVSQQCAHHATCPIVIVRARPGTPSS